MGRSPRLTALAAALSLALSAVLGACSGDPGIPRPSSPPIVVPEATFVQAVPRGVISDWDPATAHSGEIIAMQNIYDTLTVYNPVTKRAGPRLATGWTASSDARTWTFTLREGVRFHTGRPLDAAAVKAAIDRTRRIKRGAAYIWAAVDEIRVTDPTTVVFMLRYPAPLDLIASSGYGAYIYDTTAAGSGDLRAWFAAGRDAGTGPYTVETWRKGAERELRLHYFGGYWGGWDGSRYRNVEFRVEPSARTAWRMLLNGEVSLVERFSAPLFRKAAATAGLRTTQTPSFQNMLLLFNTASGPLRDVRLRKAVRDAIDYAGVIKALKGGGTAPSGLVPSGLLGHIPRHVPRQNLARAKRLLQQAGYGPTGRPLRLTLTYARGDDDQRMLVRMLSAELAKLNITLDARAMEWNEQWARGKATDPAKRQDIFAMYWWLDYGDAYSWFINLFHSADSVAFNLTYLNDRAIDRQIDRLPTLIATDRSAAQQAYVRLQKELLDRKAVAAVTWVTSYQRAYLGGVRNYTDNPAYPNVVFVHELEPRG